MIVDQGGDTNVALSPDSTSPVGAVFYIGDGSSRRLETVDGLRLAILAAASKASL